MSSKTKRRITVRECKKRLTEAQGQLGNVRWDKLVIPSMPLNLREIDVLEAIVTDLQIVLAGAKKHQHRKYLQALRTLRK